MMKSEFIKLTGFEPTEEEYSVIEKNYMDFGGDKFEFCRNWTASDEIKWILRDREIQKLTKILAETTKELNDVKKQILDWKPCNGGTNLNQMEYDELAGSCAAKILTDEEAKKILYDNFGFAAEKISIIDSVNTYESNRYHRMRIANTYYRNSIYMSSDYNYIRFNCTINNLRKNYRYDFLL